VIQIGRAHSRRRCHVDHAIERRCMRDSFDSCGLHFADCGNFLDCWKFAYFAHYDKNFVDYFVAVCGTVSVAAHVVECIVVEHIPVVRIIVREFAVVAVGEHFSLSR